MPSHQSSIPFEQLVTAARSQKYELSRRHAAFAQLVMQFRSTTLTYAYQILGDEQLAQDVSQEAFLTAYQRLDQLREPAAFSWWLRRIVHTHCHRLMRTKRPTTVPLDVLDSALSVNGDFAQLLADEDTAQSMVDSVLNAVADLPEHERIVVRLFYFNGYSIRDVAHSLDLPITTIKKRLQYARDRLRKQLRERFTSINMTINMTIQTLTFQVGQWLLPLLSVTTIPAQLSPMALPTGATNQRWPR